MSNDIFDSTAMEEILLNRIQGETPSSSIYTTTYLRYIPKETLQRMLLKNKTYNSI